MDTKVVFKGNTPYKNVCWKCNNPIDETMYRCQCGYYVCPECGACRPECGASFTRNSQETKEYAEFLENS